VVLEFGDDDLVTRTQRRAERVCREVQSLGRVLGEHDLVPIRRTDERRNLVARTLVGLGRLRTQLVHRPCHVGVVVCVVVRDRVDDDLRLLRGVRRVEVHQRQVSRQPARQDREVTPDAVGERIQGDVGARRAAR